MSMKTAFAPRPTTSVGVAANNAANNDDLLARYKPLLNLFPGGEFAQLGNVVVGVVDLTPHAANAILERHQPLREDGEKANRKIVTGNLRQIICSVNDGRFAFTGESIIFDDQMCEIDGNHRTTAVSITDKAIRVLIVVGVPRETFRYLDQGAMRSGGTVLQLEGISNYRDVAAACKSLHVFLGTGNFDTSGRTGSYTSRVRDDLRGNDKLLDFLQRHPGLVASIAYVKRHRRACRLTRSCGPLGAIAYVLGAVDRDLCDKFFAVLDAADEDLMGMDSAYHPVLKLRTRLRDDKLVPSEVTALLLKTWNLIRKGETRQVLVWRSDEAYPQISGLLYTKEGVPLLPGHLPPSDSDSDSNSEGDSEAAS